MRKIRTFNSISVQGLDRFPRDHYEISSEFSQPDGIMLRSQKLHDFEFSSSLKAIARCGAGVNNIPIEACTKQGIVVFNTPGANANAVKELVISGMLLNARKLLASVDFVRALDSDQDPEAFTKEVEACKKNFVGSELAGKTLGVIGLGAIGAELAHAALALNMDVVGYDPALSVDAAWRLSSQIDRAENLGTLLGRCDYISLHVPANKHTLGMLNSENLKDLKNGACLLNFSRDGIADQDAVLGALEDGRMSQYICDFPNQELQRHPKVLLLPHLGASTREAEENCARMAADQLMDFLENGNIKNSVNFPHIHLSRTKGFRIAFANDNVPSVLSQVLNLFSEMKINVIDLLNKSRGDIAYTIVDIEKQATDELLSSISEIEHVSHVNTF